MERAKTIIGIDVGSESVSVAVMHSVIQKEKHEEKFSNTNQGFEELRDWLRINNAAADEAW